MPRGDRKVRPVLLKLTGLLLAVVLILAATGCDPRAPISVENRTDQTLTIWINDYEIGNVSPWETIENNGVAFIYNDYLVRAKDSEGNLIFSRSVSTHEILASKDMDEIDFLVVIEAQ